MIDEAKLQQIRSRHLDIDPLYGIFTSGSTGQPKGVLVCHRSVIDFIDVFTETFSICPNEVIGNQAPWDFDVSVKDIYSTICSGATMQIIPKAIFFHADKAAGLPVRAGSHDFDLGSERTLHHQHAQRL